MGILESAVPKVWQDKMKHQRFEYVGKGQAKFISFCETLEPIDPKKHKERNREMQKKKQRQNLWLRPRDELQKGREEPMTTL
eukprot:8915109-Ditylum_brightwellii.AAC.2